MNTIRKVIQNSILDAVKIGISQAREDMQVLDEESINVLIEETLSKIEDTLMVVVDA